MGMKQDHEIYERRRFQVLQNSNLIFTHFKSSLCGKIRGKKHQRLAGVSLSPPKSVNATQKTKNV